MRRAANGIEKEMRLTLSPTAPRVEVVHRLTNRNPWAVELAVWALSVMAPGGRAVIPQEDFVPHPDVLAPARSLVLWSLHRYERSRDGPGVAGTSSSARTRARRRSRRRACSTERAGRRTFSAAPRSSRATGTSLTRPTRTWAATPRRTPTRDARGRNAGTDHQARARGARRPCGVVGPGEGRLRSRRRRNRRPSSAAGR